MRSIRKIQENVGENGDRGSGRKHIKTQEIMEGYGGLGDGKDGKDGYTGWQTVY